MRGGPPGPGRAGAEGPGPGVPGGFARKQGKAAPAAGLRGGQDARGRPRRATGRAAPGPGAASDSWIRRRPRPGRSSSASRPIRRPGNPPKGTARFLDSRVAIVERFSKRPFTGKLEVYVFSTPEQWRDILGEWDWEAQAAQEKTVYMIAGRHLLQPDADAVVLSRQRRDEGGAEVHVHRERLRGRLLRQQDVGRADPAQAADMKRQGTIPRLPELAKSTSQANTIVALGASLRGPLTKAYGEEKFLDLWKAMDEDDGGARPHLRQAARPSSRPNGSSPSGSSPWRGRPGSAYRRAAVRGTGRRSRAQPRGAGPGPGNPPARIGLWQAAAAVLLLAGLGAWWLVAGGYPRPQASGSYTVADGGVVCRGQRLRTEEQPAASELLGGYARVEVEPQSVVRLEGSAWAECVFLGQGGVACSVDRRSVPSPFARISAACDPREPVQRPDPRGEGRRRDAEVAGAASWLAWSWPRERGGSRCWRWARRKRCQKPRARRL